MLNFRGVNILILASLCDLFGMLKTWPFNRLSDLQLRNLKVTVTLNDLDGKSQILASIDPSENGKGLFNGLRCSHTTKRHSFGRWNRDGLISLADAGTIHQQTPYSEGQWPVATNHLDHRLVWLCHLGSHYHCNGCGIKPNENRVRACWNTAMHPNWWSNYHIAIDIISTDIYIKTRFLSLKQRSKTSSFRMPGTSKPPFVELFAPSHHDANAITEIPGVLHHLLPVFIQIASGQCHGNLHHVLRSPIFETIHLTKSTWTNSIV